jgi:hypothetical protein
VNLRKDHCRDPDQNRPRTRHPACRRQHRLSLGQVLDNLLSSEWGLGVKEPTTPKASRNTVPSSGTRTACWPPPVLQCYLIDMTLGNGYLGSRIDEERSEMRYLV